MRAERKMVHIAGIMMLPHTQSSPCSRVHTRSQTPNNLHQRANDVSSGVAQEMINALLADQSSGCLPGLMRELQGICALGDRSPCLQVG